MKKSAKIYVAGNQGMVEFAKELKGNSNLI